MVFIRAAEAEDIPSLQTLFLQLGYQTETAILAQRITAPQRMMSALVAETENAVCGVIVINFILPVHENRFMGINFRAGHRGIVTWIRDRPATSPGRRAPRP